MVNATKPRLRKRSPAVTVHSGNSGNQQMNQLSDEVRREMISVNAYFRAQARGFSSDGVDDDWFGAQIEIDETLRKNILE